MDEQRQDNQLEPINSNSVPIQDVALKTYRELWTIKTGGERGSGRSVLAVRHDDDYDDDALISLQDSSDNVEEVGFTIRGTAAFLFLCHIILAVTVSFERPVVLALSYLCVWKKCLGEIYLQ